MRSCAVVLILGALAGAQGEQSRRLAPDHAPTPFSAAEIRAACPSGRMSKFLFERIGRPPSHQTLRFSKCDEKGTDVEVEVTDAGKRTTEKGRIKWRKLQRHASFPEAQTKIEQAQVETPVGIFQCRLYIVTKKKIVSRFYFATKLPGLPVKSTRHADGKLVFTMTLVEHADPRRFLAALGHAALPAKRRAAYEADFAKAKDGKLTREQYVARRAATDEATATFKAMDKDENGRLTREELAIADKVLAKEAFRQLDTNSDTELTLPEVIHVWTVWVRAR